MKVIDNNNTASDSNKYIGTRDNFFHNLAGYKDIDSYTIGGLIDDFYLSLVCAKEHVTSNSKIMILISKYYLQAWKLQRLISVGNPPPYYVINISDLTPKLVEALRELDYQTQNFVINLAIGRIFENINPKCTISALKTSLEYGTITVAS